VPGSYAMHYVRDKQAKCLAYFNKKMAVFYFMKEIKEEMFKYAVTCLDCGKTIEFELPAHFWVTGLTITCKPHRCKK